LELVLTSPDIGAVLGNEDGDVAHDPDAALVGVPAKFHPLALERPLREFDEGDFVRQLTPRCFKRR
jgi:hypothetical protein